MSAKLNRKSKAYLLTEVILGYFKRHRPPKRRRKARANYEARKKKMALKNLDIILRTRAFWEPTPTIFPKGGIMDTKNEGEYIVPRKRKKTFKEWT